MRQPLRNTAGCWLRWLSARRARHTSRPSDQEIGKSRKMGIYSLFDEPGSDSTVPQPVQGLRNVAGTGREYVVREAFKDLLKGWVCSRDLNCVSGIFSEAQDYRLGSRSALE